MEYVALNNYVISDFDYNKPHIKNDNLINLYFIISHFFEIKVLFTLNQAQNNNG